MQFPETDRKPRLSQRERASQRIRYLFIRAALHVGQRGSVRGLARAIGMNHSTLHKAIDDGYCSPNVAIKIEELCSRKHTPHEWLRRPLDIPVDTETN